MTDTTQTPAKNAPKGKGGRKPKSAEDKAKIDAESKADKFKRLGKSRVTAILGKIKLLRALSNKASYEYTPEQVAQIFRTIRGRVDEVETAYAASAKAGKEEFDFNG